MWLKFWWTFTNFGNCTLTRGRTCFMIVYGVHRHLMWGSDADQFKPERWLDPATLPQCPTAFAGFSMGRRIYIGNYTLKKGRTCVLFIFGVSIISYMWGSEVEKFKPERWIDRASMPEFSNALAGFGMGRWSCIGKPYALMLIKTTLVHVFRRCRMSGNHSMMVTKIDVMLRTLSEHHVSIEMRKK